nr:hypothetical protein [Gimesia aquarii]
MNYGLNKDWSFRLRGPSSSIPFQTFCPKNHRRFDTVIGIESRVNWPRGGESIYFRNPDNHVVELATPGIWPIF